MLRWIVGVRLSGILSSVITLIVAHLWPNGGLRGTRVGAEEVSLVHGAKPVHLHHRRPPTVIIALLLIPAFFHFRLQLFLATRLAHMAQYSSLCFIELFLLPRLWRSPMSSVLN